MKTFARLYSAIDSTTKSNSKVAFMENYFRVASPADAAWAAFFLRGGKLRAPFPSRLLCKWAADIAGIPAWLFEECYESVGDLAETVALLLPEGDDPVSDTEDLSSWVINRLVPLRNQSGEEQRNSMAESWSRLSTAERFVWNKLVTGSFRVGVSEGLVNRAIAAASGVDATVIAHRLAGNWQPSASAWMKVIQLDIADATASQPYPSCLAHPLDGEPHELGAIEDWVIEYKWDGIRAQVIRREGLGHIWSRGGELLTERFPEIVAQASAWPDGTVVDGEILAWREGPLPFADLQHRITRKSPAKKVLQTIPARLVAFDLLEWQGHDLRSQPLRHRLDTLQLISAYQSERLTPKTWEEAEQLRMSARERMSEGLMLKAANGKYGVGRVRGLWWKWKLKPFSADAVLVYAQRGHGRRASLYTDYTFAVWDGDQLVPFAKAYSGLTDVEIRAVDSFIRRNTIEKFGPVSTVKPELVFEIAFDGIQLSSRHKSGIAVRFPRMARWRTDKKPADADTLANVRALLPEGSTK